MTKQESSPLQRKLQNLPDAPGVYLYKNKAGEDLYIGKAKSLKKRVSSYFQSAQSLRIRIMLALAYDLEVIVTHSEAEALTLEAKLIRARQPRYNIALKDDKSYPYFKLTLNETFPRLLIVREKFEKGSEYYGPFTSVDDAKNLWRIIQKNFMLRNKRLKLDGSKIYRPCINFQLGRCLAPCRGDVSTQTYLQEVQKVKMFLKGKHQSLIHLLESQMYASSKKLKFENAAKLRNQIRVIQKTLKPDLTQALDHQYSDVIGFHRQLGSACIAILFLRYGKLLSLDAIHFDSIENASDANLLGQALNRLYTGERAYIPKKILLPMPYTDALPLAQELETVVNHKVQILTPKRGANMRLIEMANANALQKLNEHQSQQSQIESLLQKVQAELNLKRLPRVVEAFDISNTSGMDSVGCMVRWEGNKACPQQYRTFKIRTVMGADDFASMYEVIKRRYARLLNESPSAFPDLILIDGGRGQLHSSVNALQDLGVNIEKIDILGLAKGRTERKQKRHQPREYDFEYLLKPAQKNEIRLAKSSVALSYFKTIRDDVHDFSVRSHRKLRQKRGFSSQLENIPHIGKKRHQLLLKHFGSLKAIRNAPLSKLQTILPKHAAEHLIHFFTEQSSTSS